MRVEHPPGAGVAGSPTTNSLPAHGAERFWTVPFLLLLPAGFLGYGNVYILVPTIPGYIERLGGSHADLGLAMAALSVAALAIRPWSGWLTDRLGSKLVLMLGVGTMAFGSLAYLPANSVSAAVLVRIVHGIGWGLFSVAGAAMASELSPPGRRGASLSVYGMTGGVALALGPVLGTLLGSGYTTFLAAAVGGSVSLGLAALLPRRMRHRRGGDAPRFMLVSRAALLPAVMVLIFMGTYGVVFSFVPVLTEQRHLGGPAWFFTPYATAMVLSRAVTGGISDRYGRARIIAPGMALSALALGLLAVSASHVTLIGAALLYAGGMAAIYPISLAWATDRSKPEERGAAIATVTAAQDLGISSGSIVAGQVADVVGLGTVFMAFAALALLGLVLAGTLDYRERRPPRPESTRQACGN